MTDNSHTREYILTGSELNELRGALSTLAASGLSPVQPGFYAEYGGCHELLPIGLRRFLANFRDSKQATFCTVRTFPVDDAAVGPTPEHWERRDGDGSTIEPDLCLAMCASTLGEPFAWATLQYGRIIQDVFPIRGDERRESGHGSDKFLEFHTDDAFRPDSPDYLLLLGIRNQDLIPSFVTPARDIKLSEDHLEMLWQERFYVVPDDEHIRQLELRAPDDPALARAIEMRDNPRPVGVFFGDRANPCIRLDIPFMRCVGDDPEVKKALLALRFELDRARQAQIVTAGTVLILNNRAVAHARDAFTARYDGTDRWLRKMIVGRGTAATSRSEAVRVRL